MMVVLDELDERIIEMLRLDGRMSNRSIGRELGVGESTIRKRLKRLESSKAMRLAVICDVSVLQIGAFAFIRASVAPANAQRVAEFLASLEETSFVAQSIGQYNIVALISVKSNNELAEIIHDQLSMISDVHEFSVREIVDVIKHRWDIVQIPR